jgi:hypothetical protein
MLRALEASVEFIPEGDQFHWRLAVLDRLNCHQGFLASMAFTVWIENSWWLLHLLKKDAPAVCSTSL